MTRLDQSKFLDSTAIGLSQISIAEAYRMDFLSGQTATRQDGGAMPRDLSGQPRTVAANLAAALQEWLARV